MFEVSILGSMKLRFWKRDDPTEAKADAIPADLKPYYEPQKSGIKRILGIIGSILLGLIILALLFLAGRWLIHKLTDSSGSKAEQAQTAANKAQKDADKKADEAKKAKKTAADKAADKAKKEEKEKKKAAGQSAPAEPPAPAPSPEPTLPNTGG